MPARSSEPKDHDSLTASPDGRSSSPSGHRREVLHEKSGRLVELEGCCGRKPPVRTPVNLLQGLTIESRSTLFRTERDTMGTCRYPPRPLTGRRQRERSRTSRISGRRSPAVVYPCAGDSQKAPPQSMNGPHGSPPAALAEPIEAAEQVVGRPVRQRVPYRHLPDRQRHFHQYER